MRNLHRYVCLVQTGDKNACHVAIFIHSLVAETRGENECFRNSQTPFSQCYQRNKDRIMIHEEADHFSKRMMNSF